MIKQLLTIPIIFIILGSIVINLIVYNTNISLKEQKRLYNLFFYSFLLIVILGTINYYIANKKYKKKYKKNLSFFHFINKGEMKNDFFKRVLVGFGSGIVFGIIDNSGLWFGMDALDPILPNGLLTKAGFGNVFSDSLSAFLATFTGDIISKLTGMDSHSPIWADAAGTFTGCIIGLYLCRFITGRV